METSKNISYDIKAEEWESIKELLPGKEKGEKGLGQTTDYS
jgi:hypothetical protein